MKINKIASHSTLAVKHAEIDVNSPITLICGKNEAGKSSLRDGIYQAFTGENPRVSLKKEYKFLVNDTADDVVGYTYVDYDNGMKACITLPNGTHELSQQLHVALPYVINPALFACIAPDERRRFLFDLGNLRSDGTEVKGKLLERGCDSSKVEMILPFLRSSFDNAQKHAAEKTKEARANWKATTGEAYGDKKAADWKASVPVVDAKAKDEAVEDLTGIDRELEETNQKIGALQALLNGANQNAGEIARLRDLASKETRIREKLDHDRYQVDEWQIKIDETRKLAMGSKPGAIACKCPECDSELVFDGEKLLALAGDLQGDEDAAASLGKYESALSMFVNAVKNGERDLAAATAAREQLSLMESDKNTAPNPEEIEALRNKIALLKASRKQAQDTLDLINKNFRIAAEAEEKTKKAAEHHAEAQAWDLITSALAPDGIPGEMLHVALDPINTRLAESASATSWKPVIINPDMSISYEGRPYGLSSASAKWRANVMIAEAISHVAGIKFLMADEFDLLDLPSRSACLKWLIGLTRSGEIDSVLLFGTLKEKPAKLPPEVSAHWIENGFVHDHKEEAA